MQASNGNHNLTSAIPECGQGGAGRGGSKCGGDERCLDGKRVVAVVPAYNEERFIGSVVLKARKYAGAVIVVDDGSSDATAEVALAAGALVVVHEQNQGKGAALNSGFQKAWELDPDVVVTIDGDGQHVPQEMATVAGPVLAGEADIVVGSRYLRRRCGVPRHRIWGHRLFNLMTNTASGVAVTDSQSGYRAFSPRALQTISFQSNGFSVESEMQFIAREHGLKLVEAPISAHYLDKPKRPVLSHGLMVLNGLLQLVGQYRPLLFFGATGLLLLLVGSVWGFYIVHIYRRTDELAMGYALICVLLCILGNLSLTTGIILHSMRGLLLQYLPNRRQISIPRAFSQAHSYQK